MLNAICKIICVGLIAVLGHSHAFAQTIVLPNPNPPEETFQGNFQPSDATQYAPLQQVLPRATRESGVLFKAQEPVLNEEVPVNETGPKHNLDLDPVLDVFSRIELFDDESKLQTVIILNRNIGEASQAPKGPAISNRPVRPAYSNPAQNLKARSASQPFTTTKLSQEKLQKLIRGAYRSPLQANLWDDPEYREFLIEQGINSPEEMKDRKKAKNLRKNVRRLLWKLKNKSSE